MKGRLITNGILGIAATISFVVYMVLIVKFASAASTHSVSFNYLNTYTPASKNPYILSYWISAVSWFLSMLASFVMGIVTLAMYKENVRGLGIASGVLGIVIGVPGVGIALAIVSFIGVKKL